MKQFMVFHPTSGLRTAVACGAAVSQPTTTTRDRETTATCRVRAGGASRRMNREGRHLNGIDDAGEIPIGVIGAGLGVDHPPPGIPERVSRWSSSLRGRPVGR